MAGLEAVLKSSDTSWSGMLKHLLPGVKLKPQCGWRLKQFAACAVKENKTSARPETAPILPPCNNQKSDKKSHSQAQRDF